MSHCPTLWDVLHDGEITNVSGKVPGDVVLQVDIDYLRRRFSESGDRFEITLQGCTRFTFVPWTDQQAQPAGPTRLDGTQVVTILSADDAGSFCRVHCVPGTLEVAAENVVVRLDTGRLVSLDELMRVAEDYWREWEANSPSKDV